MSGGRVIIFGGTSEGRELVEMFAGTAAEVDVCVATRQGAEMLPEAPNIRVREGRLTSDEMAAMMREASPLAVIDATHPYAVEASKNIVRACGESGARYVSVIRARSSAAEGAIRVKSAEAAADYLDGVEGNILLTVGARTLAVYARVRGFAKRVWARALPTAELIETAREIGLPSDKLICMQGPFSTELNVAMMRQIGARYIVTKESGGAGGFDEKIEAARAVGASAVVIERPSEDTGVSVDECASMIETLCGVSRNERPKSVAVIGIGTGAADMMTLRAADAVASADLVIGSRRCVESAAAGARAEISIDPEEIARIIESTSARRIAVLMSGDTGAFSGARKLIPLISRLSPEIIPGISSIAHLCARTGESWDDAAIASVHGRETNFTAIVRENAKTILVAGGSGGTSRAIDELCRLGLGGASVTVGEDLSLPTERITTGTADELRGRELSPLSIMLIRNASPARFVPGMPDDAFTRGDAPMTKSEVRAVIMSKLRVTADAVCWDVGAGTGSVSIEMACSAPRGEVLAIERDGGAAALIEENARRLAVSNIRTVHGSAPDALVGLKAPTHVFIGGSGGRIADVIDAVRSASPDARTVISSITAETFAAALTKLKADGARGLEITQVSIARGRPVGGLHMMTAQNPITLISCGGMP